MNTPAIQIHDLHKHYGKVHALRGVTVTVPSGAVGLLGPNGAGKTTLIKLLLGMLAPDSGSARIAGLDPSDKHARLAIRQRVGYMPESDCLIPGMSAVEIVALLGRLTGMPATDAMTRAHEVLDYVGTGEERYRKSDEYSTGMKQRIKLAQALVHDPPILLLDEPTNGLDPKGRRSLLDLVADLGRNQGKNVLLCTHLLPDVGRTCDHVLVMNHGEVVKQESIANLTATSASVLELAVEGDVQALIAALEREGHRIQLREGGSLEV
ncbi:MAG TPA: ABC transporter ATP-binding protein, partial [Planctomycetota bacterium]|nr:ABC transporter ATP-binding protein [Planctomycetota bacterium]